MKDDAKLDGSSATASRDWEYMPHEFEELLRMAEKTRAAASARQSTPRDLRLARSAKTAPAS